MSGGEFDRDGVADLFYFALFGAGKLIMGREGMGAAEFMVLKHADKDIDADFRAVMFDSGLDKAKAIGSGDGIQWFIDRFADSGAVIFADHGLGQDHVLLGDDGSQRSIDGAGIAAIASGLIGLNNDRLDQREPIGSVLRGQRLIDRMVPLIAARPVMIRADERLDQADGTGSCYGWQWLTDAARGGSALLSDNKGLAKQHVIAACSDGRQGLID